MPIILISCLYFFYKIDFYELFVKFLPIYALMVSDIIVSLYFLKYDVNYLGFEYFVYPHFFLHFLYIIPIIYYLTKPLSPFILNKKNNLNTIKQGIFIFFNSWSKFYLSLILILLLIFFDFTYGILKMKKLEFNAAYYFGPKRIKILKKKNF